MRSLAPILLGLSLLLGCRPQTGATEPAALAAPLPADYAELGQRLHAAVPAIMAQHDATSISIAVVDGQELVYAESFGLAERGGERAATTETVYEIGSISKPFVGLAVMRLVEAGVLDLDVPIDRYLEEFSIQSRFPGASVPTLRELLSHRSGIPSDMPTLLERPDYAIAQLPDALREEWLIQPPGRATIYSNVGFDLAALVVERSVGRDYGEYLEQEVLEPLGMGGASTRLGDAQREALAIGYDEAKAAAKPITYKPCGSIRATVTELAQLVKWVNGRGEVDATRLVSEASVAEMMRPQNAGADLDLGTLVGLSWFIGPGTERSGDIVTHNGATGGFMSELSVSLDHGVGIVVLGNDRSPAVHAIATQTLALAVGAKTGVDLEAELATVDVAPAPPTQAMTPAFLDEVASHTYSDGFSRLRFEHRRGRLHAKLGKHQALRLIPREDGTFDIDARAWGFPIRAFMPGFRISYETLDGELVLVARAPSKWAFVFARRYEPGPISDAWRERAGSYAPVGEAEAVIERLELEVTDEGVRVVAHAPGRKRPLNFVLEVHDDALATVAGYGRGSGGAVVVESRGGKTVLRAQGLEFIESP